MNHPSPNNRTAPARKVLPTKVYYPLPPESCPEDWLDEDPNATATTDPDAPPRWTAQPVLEWLESLAIATENAEDWVATAAAASSGGNGWWGEEEEDDLQLDPGAPGAATNPPISIDSIQLSAKSPPIPTWAQNQVVPPHDSGPYAAKLGVEDAIKSTHHKNKRIRDTHEDRTADSNHYLPWAMGPVPKQWDLSILQRDSFAWDHGASCIHQLACQVEDQVITNGKRGNNVVAAYQRIQTSLQYTFDAIWGQYPYGTSSESGDLRLLLNTLYEEVIGKLQALLDQYAPKKKKPALAVTAVSADPPPANSGTVKRDLGAFMTAWLRDNWINPYPDEATLKQLAGECGGDVTPSQVSNWLINARTRKWRPAIVQASSLAHRPSHMLLHDSIHLFDGKPIRELKDGMGRDEEGAEGQPAPSHDNETTDLHYCDDAENDDGTYRFRSNKRFRSGTDV